MEVPAEVELSLTGDVPVYVTFPGTVNWIADSGESVVG